MKLIVGLGNPGKKYQNSKHNIGFMALDSYAQLYKMKLKKSIKFHGEYIKNDNVILLKPKTFMNNSGLSVRQISDYYNINYEDILIIFDELNLPFSKIRLRKNGTAGGHNGIKSIIAHLGTDNFKRLRIGIDRNQGKEIKEDVLSDFSKIELKKLKDAFILTNNILDDFVSGIDFDQIMNSYN